MRIPSGLLFMLISLLYGGCSTAIPLPPGEDPDYRAYCSTIPSGEQVAVLAGIEPIDIILTYAVPCEQGPLCTGATFKSIMNTNEFFGPQHIFDKTLVATGVQKSYLIDTRNWEGSDQIVIQVKSDQTGDSILAACDFTLTAIDPRPESPLLTSSTHVRGQTSCDRTLTLAWMTPSAHRGLGGYSYIIVNQDNPLYDTIRWPDEIIELDAAVTDFTSDPLEAGHIWEFNLLAIDAEGLAAEYYSSFWVVIDQCEVVITRPRSDDSFEIGKWVNIFWEPVTYNGDDVGGGYYVDSIDLLKGAVVVSNLGINLLNTLSYGFIVPDVAPGSDYRIRITLGRNSSGDMFPELPETLIGHSSAFAIIPSSN